jgi:hexosaminidase
MLVPWPRSCRPSPGHLALTAESTVDGPPDIVALVRELLGPATGFTFPEDASGGGTLRFAVDRDDVDLGEEGYRLDVEPGGARAVAASVAGLRWAAQSLRQLLPAEIYGAAARPAGGWTLPCVSIVDGPRYPWRGVMIDVGRWHKPISWLFRVVDLAAMHRLNVVHLHLTDDQGWRFEVRRHPRLTEVGSVRRESPAGHNSAGTGDGTPHGGHYTQDQLRELVAYAERRGVTIVPEIDLPGHTQAAVAAYPALGNDPTTPVEVWTRFGISPHVLNCDDATVDVIRDVLDELMDVFPSPFIHLGGDEVPPGEWAVNVGAQKRMAELGLTDPEGLLGWWIGRLTEHVRSRGRTAVVWDELVGSGVADGTVVMAWRGEGRVAEALTAGHRVVACPHTRLYLNYPASDAPGEPLSIADGGSPEVVTIPLSTMYGYRPGTADDGVVGIQANLWTEYAATPERAEYDLMPRLAAVAEVAWGTADSLDEFTDRLRAHLRRLDAAGIGYRPLGP